MKQELLYNGAPLTFEVTQDSGTIRLRLRDSEYELRAEESAPGRLRMTSANGVLCACAVRDRDRILVWQNGRSFEFSKPSAVDDSPESEGFSKNELHAPMPGTLIKLNVTAGDAVIAGQTVAVVEAMKMEHNLRAPRTGVVAKVNAKVGEIVGTDTALVVLASEE